MLTASAFDHRFSGSLWDKLPQNFLLNCFQTQAPSQTLDILFFFKEAALSCSMP